MTAPLNKRLTPVSQDDRRWVAAQPVIGTPSLKRLRAALAAEGWRPVELVLSDDQELINFHLERGQPVRAMSREQSLRGLIQVFRSAGFDVGFSEVCVDDLDDHFMRGASLTAPVNQICETGPVMVGL